MVVESLILFLQKIKFNRGLAIIVAYIVFIVFLLWLLIFVVPFLLTQIAELVSIWLWHIAWLQEILATKGITGVVMETKLLPWVAKEYFLNYFGESDVLVQVQSVLQENLAEIISVGKGYVQVFGSVIVNFVAWFASMIIDFTLFMTLAVLFSLEKDSVMKFLANISGAGNYALTHMKLERMYKKLGIWLKARLALSLFIAIAMWLAMVVMSRFGVEIPNKLWLAILTWLLDIIPYIWPFISGALLFVVWMIYNTIWVAVLAVWALFGVNLIQNNILTPLFMNRALGVNAVLILISMVIWWMIMWFLWVLLAVPIAVIITLMTQNEKEFKAEEKEQKAKEQANYKKTESKRKITKEVIKKVIKKTPIKKTTKKTIKKVTKK